MQGRPWTLSTGKNSQQLERKALLDQTDDFRLVGQHLKTDKTDEEDRTLYEQPLRTEEAHKQGTLEARIGLAISLI